MRVLFNCFTFLLINYVLAKTNLESIEDSIDKTTSLTVYTNNNSQSNHCLQIQIDLQDVGDELANFINSSRKLNSDQLAFLSDVLRATDSSKVKLSIHDKPVKPSTFQFLTLRNYCSSMIQLFTNYILWLPNQIKNGWRYIANELSKDMRKERNKRIENHYNDARIYGQEGHIHYSYRPTFKFLNEIVVDHEAISEILRKRIDKIKKGSNRIFYQPRRYSCFLIMRGNKLKSDTWVGTVVFGGDSHVSSASCSEVVSAAYNIETKSLVWYDSGKLL